MLCSPSRRFHVTVASRIAATVKHASQPKTETASDSPSEQTAVQQCPADHDLERGGAAFHAEGLPPSVPQPSKPYVPPPPFPIRPRKGIEAPEYYSSRSAAGHPDPLAVLLTAGRSDPEWQWLKFLCFICVTSTFGTWVYGVFFPQHLKWFKDEPWSPFRN